MILSLKNLIRERRAAQVKAAEIERVKQAESDKIWGNQLANEIKLRCESLTRRIGVDPVSLPDSQILEFNAGLYHLENDASRILEKLTEYSRHVVVLGEIEQLKKLNELLNHTLGGKDDFIMAVRREIEVRDLSKEKIKNALGLKIKIPKFCGDDSALDIYSFREKFEKFVMPYVQKPLLADTLKYNYLGEPALTMVKELTDIEEIWERLMKSYGDPTALLQNKLEGLCQLGGLENIR